MDHLTVPPGRVNAEWSKGPMYGQRPRRTLQRTFGEDARRLVRVVRRLREGGSSVKKQTLILVLIGAILFIAGRYRLRQRAWCEQVYWRPDARLRLDDHLRRRCKVGHPSGNHWTGDGLELGRARSPCQPSLSGQRSDLAPSLYDEVLTGADQKGRRQCGRTERQYSAISVPQGLDAMTVTLPAPNGVRLSPARRPRRHLRQHDEGVESRARYGYAAGALHGAGHGRHRGPRRVEHQPLARGHQGRRWAQTCRLPRRCCSP